MESEAILAELLDRGVLEETAGDGSIAISPSFLELVEDERSLLEDGEEVRDRLADRVDDPELAETLAGLGEDNPEFVAHYLALHARTDDLSRDEITQTAAVLVQFEGDQPASEGAPEGFLPVHGDQLPTLLGLTPRAIVYVWREDCPPCDLVKEDFEELYGGAPEDIASFAVYGPDWAEFLYEEYDVAGAPTTLFVIDGEVDARLQGAFQPEVLDGEVELLRELA